MQSTTQPPGLRIYIVWLGYCLLFLVCLPTARAEIFQFYDSQGVLHLTDKPSKNSKAKRISRNARRTSFHTSNELKKKYNGYVDSICREHNMDPYLVQAVIEVESSYNHLAVSPKNARGLMQLIPETARRFGVKNVFDPYSNIEGGVLYLKYLFKLFDDELSLILAAYNCGERRVIECGDIPPFKETQDYVKRVMDIYSKYQSDYGLPQRIVRYTDDNGTVHLSNRPNASN
ncbi:transglycosylase SLT domain-containing protein [bacterium]|nr:transglycosylase SLT domain-containing protein [bacterium]